ncbi:hypothetical protein FKM82_015512 [Ascaphus truei]
MSNRCMKQLSGNHRLKIASGRRKETPLVSEVQKRRCQMWYSLISDKLPAAGRRLQNTAHCFRYDTIKGSILAFLLLLLFF